MPSWLYFSLIACRIDRLQTVMSRVKMKGADAPALDMSSKRCYFVDRAAAADAAPALK